MDDSVQKRFCAQCKELELERVLVHLCLRQLNPRLCFLNPWTAFWAIYRLLPVKIIGIISSLSVVNYSPVSKEDHGLRLRRTMEGVSHTLISHFNQYGHSDWHCCSVWKHKVRNVKLCQICADGLLSFYIYLFYFSFPGSVTDPSEAGGCLWAGGVQSFHRHHTSECFSEWSWQLNDQKAVKQVSGNVSISGG